MNKTDKLVTLDKVKDFLNDKEKRVLFLEGYDDEDKLKIIGYCLNNSIYNKGVIRTSNNISDAQRILKRLGVKNPKSNYKYFEKIKVSNLIIEFDSYTKQNKLGYPKENDFTIIYPIQTIADRLDEHEGFLEMINNLMSKKIIMITTNDHSYNFDWLRAIADEVIIHNSENDKPKLTENIKQHLAYNKQIEDFRKKGNK